MLDKLNALSDHALMNLKAQVDQLVERRRASLLRVGSLATFKSKYGDMITLKITGRGSVNYTGVAVDEYGREKSGAGSRWRVHPQFLTPVVNPPKSAPLTAPAGGGW